MFSLLSNETEIWLPELGTNAMPLLANVPLSHASTVELRFSDRYPVFVTETALRSLLPNAGALL
jgi:hypothetical protein